MYIMLFISV